MDDLFIKDVIPLARGLYVIHSKHVLLTVRQVPSRDNNRYEGLSRRNGPLGMLQLSKEIRHGA